MHLLDKIRQNLRCKKGFTLIELVVVIAIIAVLVAALVPSVSGYISTARETTAMANAKLAYTTAAALVPIWDMGKTQSEPGKTYFAKYGSLDVDGGKKLANAIVGENFLTGPANEGSITIQFTNGQVTGATFTFSPGKGGSSVTYTSSNKSISAA